MECNPQSLHSKIGNGERISRSVATIGTLNNNVLHWVTICSAPLVGVCDVASRNFIDPGRKIITLRNCVQSLEDIVSRVSPIINIFQTGKTEVLHNLNITCRFLGSVSRSFSNALLSMNILWCSKFQTSCGPKRLNSAHHMHATCPTVNVLCQTAERSQRHHCWLLFQCPVELAAI